MGVGDQALRRGREARDKGDDHSHGRHTQGSQCRMIPAVEMFCRLEQDS